LSILVVAAGVVAVIVVVAVLVFVLGQRRDGDD
jgi:hypothetical protein